MCNKKALREIQNKEKKRKALLLLVILNWINVILTIFYIVSKIFI